LTCYLLPY